MAQDPDGVLSAMSKRWTLGDPVKFGCREGNGDVKKSLYNAFRKGDFVDASFSIEIKRGKNGVFFGFNLEGLILIERGKQAEVCTLARE